mmetsp:Transcript_29567/g.94232  ORF Transcript_29567/g.94232 Transcript_29567/m.94232 type:complete len:271 (-) Transcript_29567:670-1482(-)
MKPLGAWSERSLQPQAPAAPRVAARLRSARRRRVGAQQKARGRSPTPRCHSLWFATLLAMQKLLLTMSSGMVNKCQVLELEFNKKSYPAYTWPPIQMHQLVRIKSWSFNRKTCQRSMSLRSQHRLHLLVHAVFRRCRWTAPRARHAIRPASSLRGTSPSVTRHQLSCRLWKSQARLRHPLTGKLALRPKHRMHRQEVQHRRTGPRHRRRSPAGARAVAQFLWLHNRSQRRVLAEASVARRSRPRRNPRLHHGSCRVPHGNPRPRPSRLAQ